MPWPRNSMMAGFDRGADGADPVNTLSGPIQPLLTQEPRGLLTNDPQAAAVGQQFQAAVDSIRAQQQSALDQGLWTGGQVWEGGHPTSAGVTDALRGTALGVALGTGGGKETPDMVSHGVLFHGTREPITTFKPGETYLTSDQAQADAYARGVHLGGRGNTEPTVIPVATKPGRTLDVNDELFNAMDDGYDVGDALENAIANARHNGYRYVTYDHPSAGGGEDHRVVVSLHPHEDLDLSGGGAPGGQW